MASLKQLLSTKFVALACILASAGAVPTIVNAQEWQVKVGAQSGDKGTQVLAFLPNELWIHAGDTINFEFTTDEPHTVTFLTTGQVRLPFSVGCPGTTPTDSIEDGVSCVNSGPMTNGQGYSVTFPTTGNYKLVCLVHANMTAVIHVLETSAELPHDQAFYTAEAARMQTSMLSSGGQMIGMSMSDNSPTNVTAGTGKIKATGGGSETLSVMRFMHPNRIVHAGETVEWTNDDPVTAHTITFGTEPANPIPPSANVTVDPDGARHATVSSPSDNVHSGFIVAGVQDQIGLPQPPAGVTHFRVTFPKPGIYQYKCVLHDNLGMLGEVIVLP